MKSKAHRLLEEALTLPESARADLAGRLLDSIDDGDADPGWSEAWAAEIERRLGEIDSGRAKLVPWSRVRRTIIRSRRETKRRQVSR